MKTLNWTILIISISLFLSSCGSEPEPYDDFLGSYTAQKFCNDDESFTSQITPGASGTEIIWINAAGEDGTVDDYKGTVSGKTITISKQDLDGLEFSATGTLLENGNLDMATTLYAGPIQVLCGIDFTRQERPNI